MEITLKWTPPQQVLVEKLLTLARQSGKSPEEIVTEAVERYVEEQPLEVLSMGASHFCNLTVWVWLKPLPVVALSDGLTKMGCSP